MFHTFDTEIAKKVGVNAAVIYNHILYWVTKNEGENTNFIDGMWWSYATLDGLVALFPYMTKDQVRTAIQKLKDSKLIVTGNYSKDKRDRTTWYSIPPDARGKNPTTDMGKIPRYCGENPTSTIYNNISTNKSITDIYSANGENGNCEKKTKEPKHTYGEYENVKFTDTELAKLKEEFPNDWQNRIENLSGYIASTGKKYTNHLATIRNWARKEREKAEVAKQPDPNDGWAYLEEQFQKGEL